MRGRTEIVAASRIQGQAFCLCPSPLTGEGWGGGESANSTRATIRRCCEPERRNCALIRQTPSTICGRDCAADNWTDADSAAKHRLARSSSISSASSDVSSSNSTAGSMPTKKCQTCAAPAFSKPKAIASFGFGTMKYCDTPMRWLKELSNCSATTPDQSLTGSTPSLPSPLQGEGRNAMPTLALPRKGGGNRNDIGLRLPPVRKVGSAFDAQAH